MRSRSELSADLPVDFSPLAREEFRVLTKRFPFALVYVVNPSAPAEREHRRPKGEERPSSRRRVLHATSGGVRKGWSIGKHRAEVEINALQMVVRVDGVSPPALVLRSNLLGTWSFTVGKRVVELRRVRSIDVARTELWLNGVKVPHSREPIPHRPASADARCKPHPLSAASYRSSGLPPPAKIECGICRAPVCPDCRAVDGVRCKHCVEDAVEQVRKEDRARRIMGPIIAVVFIFSIALYGWVVGSPKALQCAAGATMLLGILMIHGLVRERIAR